ncbi:MAG TPA: TolC family protein [Noviherbaspirillum sp.]|nr:TolC family protein [Noviherbaspirillum sp.]
MTRPLRIVCSVALAFAAHAVGATDLVQAWEAAQRHDAEYAAASAAFEAAGTRREQARALWRPAVMFEAAAGSMSNETSMRGAQFSAPGFGQSSGVAFDTSIRSGTLDRYSLSAKQPLINRERLAQSRQLSLAADAGDMEWQNAQQSLMLRVAERYFDLVLASETLRVLRQQETSVERQLAEARDRFKLGEIPVIDTHEAGARSESIRAQRLAAESELQLKQAAFSDVTGQATQGLAGLRTDAELVPRPVVPLETWLADVTTRNPQLLMHARNLEATREEAAKQGASAAPSLDLVARMGRESLHGNGDFGNAENRSNHRMIGVQLSIPLYTGGYRSARQEEALHLVDKGRADGERLRQQLALQTRSAWLGLTVSAARISALDQARQASLTRLDATRLGRSVGDRTMLDVLNAENEATAMELALLQARIAVILDRLRLAALAGRLELDTLQSVNRLLAGTAAN